jgi:phenylacetate-CoA ligase
VDPLTGEVLPDGEEGELVLTSLTKEAMPVLRYRTRDLTRLLPGTACSMRRIEKITGRSDDMIILRGVNLFPTQIEELVLGTEELAPHFQCVLSREGQLDTMTVRIERRGDVAMEVAAAAGERVQRLVKSTIGVSIGVQVVDPETIERSVGKMKRIVDNRPER